MFDIDPTLTNLIGTVRLDALHSLGAMCDIDATPLSQVGAFRLAALLWYKHGTVIDVDPHHYHEKVNNYPYTVISCLRPHFDPEGFVRTYLPRSADLLGKELIT